MIIPRNNIAFEFVETRTRKRSNIATGTVGGDEPYLTVDLSQYAYKEVLDFCGEAFTRQSLQRAINAQAKQAYVDAHDAQGNYTESLFARDMQNLDVREESKPVLETKSKALLATLGGLNVDIIAGKEGAVERMTAAIAEIEQIQATIARRSKGSKV